MAAQSSRSGGAASSHARCPWLWRTVAETSFQGHGIILGGDFFGDKLQWGVADERLS